MADQAISELLAAATITQSDLFVLEQNGTAKKLTGQTLINDLLKMLDGHGGIQSITKVSTDVLQDTYRILFADTTFVDFVVTNGRGITSITKTNTVDLVDYYSINYNDGSSQTFEIANGAKGDQGDASYVWIKYASQKPTDSSSSFGDLPDDWMGVYVGTEPSAPTDYSQYTWFKIKGEQGDTGEPATLVYTAIEYQASTSGTIIPSGTWTESVPVVPQGQYLWTRSTQRFNTGDDIVAYTVSRMGLDGTGAVVTVSGKSPDGAGNVALTAADVSALSIVGGTMQGAIDMNLFKLQNVAVPTSDADAVPKSYVDTVVSAKATTASYTGTFLASGWVYDDNKAVYQQEIAVSGILQTDNPFVDVHLSGISAGPALKILDSWSCIGRLFVSKDNAVMAYCYEEKPTVNIPVLFKVVR